MLNKFTYLPLSLTDLSVWRVSLSLQLTCGIHKVVFVEAQMNVTLCTFVNNLAFPINTEEITFPKKSKLFFISCVLILISVNVTNKLKLYKFTLN